MRISLLIAILAAIVSSTGLAQQAPELSITGSRSHGDTVYTYVGAPTNLFVTASSELDSVRAIGSAQIIASDSVNGRITLTIEKPPIGILPVCVTARHHGEVVTMCCSLVGYIPTMRRGIREWPALKREVGTKYNPSSEWLAGEEYFSNAEYQTVVERDGLVVFDRQGTTFTDAELPEPLFIADDAVALRTLVYWRPNGTMDRSRWMLLAASSNDENAVVKLNGRRYWE